MNNYKKIFKRQLNEVAANISPDDVAGIDPNDDQGIHKALNAGYEDIEGLTDAEGNPLDHAQRYTSLLDAYGTRLEKIQDALTKMRNHLLGLSDTVGNNEIRNALSRPLQQSLKAVSNAIGEIPAAHTQVKDKVVSQIKKDRAERERERQKAKIEA